MLLETSKGRVMASLRILGNLLDASPGTPNLKHSLTECVFPLIGFSHKKAGGGVISNGSSK